MFVEQLRRAVEASPCAELPARMAHPLLPLPRPPSVRRRGSRRPFAPSQGGVYRLPHDVRDRLAAALMPFRNRDAAFALATFLGRFWSTPSRLLTAFPIDRRELANHAALGLTEGRVRGAIRTLELVGFLDRAMARGSPYQPTPDGLRRRPVLYQFGSGYGPAFGADKKAAAAGRGGRERTQPVTRPAPVLRPSAGFPAARVLKSPKSKSEAEPLVLMGEITPGLPE